MDHLETFEAWLRYQQLDAQPLSPEIEPIMRQAYAEAKDASAAARKAAPVMRGACRPGELCYAVAIEQAGVLWLTMWIKRSTKGEYFVFYPRSDRDWNPHASYHRNGRSHQKSHDRPFGVRHLKPLAQFRGTADIGAFSGHGTGSAICDPAGFTDVLRVPVGVLDGTHGSVLVDLVEPGIAFDPNHRQIPRQRIVEHRLYTECSPCISVAIAVQTL